MKKFILFLTVSFLLGGSVHCQTLKPSDPKETALFFLKSELKEIGDVTDEQFSKLADIDVNIDKEYPFLTNFTIYASKKRRIEHREAILALKEKLYPNVLTPVQMQKYKDILQKYREKPDNNKKNKKS